MRTARVVRVSSDTLFLKVAPAETLAVALADVTRLDMSTGRRQYALRGAGIGSLVDVVSGAALGFAGGDDRGWCCFSAEAKALLGGAGPGVAGLLVGAVVGSSTVSDRWTSVPLGAAHATPSFEPIRGGARFGVSVSY